MFIQLNKWAREFERWGKGCIYSPRQKSNCYPNCPGNSHVPDASSASTRTRLARANFKRPTSRWRRQTCPTLNRPTRPMARPDGGLSRVGLTRARRIWCSILQRLAHATLHACPGHASDASGGFLVGVRHSFEDRLHFESQFFQNGFNSNRSREHFAAT
jgi:hypothetical protein